MTSPTRLDVIEEARRWIGTPFQHQGRIPGVGVDCVGLIIGIALTTAWHFPLRADNQSGKTGRDTPILLPPDFTPIAS